MKNVDFPWFPGFGSCVFAYILFYVLFSYFQFFESLYEPSRLWLGWQFTGGSKSTFTWKNKLAHGKVRQKWFRMVVSKCPGKISVSRSAVTCTIEQRSKIIKTCHFLFFLFSFKIAHNVFVIVSECFLKCFWLKTWENIFFFSFWWKLWKATNICKDMNQ